MKSNIEYVKPMTIEVGGKTYTLEFSKISVRYAEEVGLELDAIDSKPFTMLMLLFHCAFKMHHPDMTIEDTDAVYDEIEGLTDEEFKKLVDLYRAQAQSFIRKKDAGERKNAKIRLLRCLVLHTLEKKDNF